MFNYKILLWLVTLFVLSIIITIMDIDPIAHFTHFKGSALILSLIVFLSLVFIEWKDYQQIKRQINKGIAEEERMLQELRQEKERQRRS